MNKSGFYLGKINVSYIIYLANPNPAISFQVTYKLYSKILLIISYTISGSNPLNRLSKVFSYFVGDALFIFNFYFLA